MFLTIVEGVGKVLLGLLGLGIVVFFHELGHFLAACAMGIRVDAFAIGWGKTIFKKKWQGVEYRLALFPVGGYCKMRGEDEDANAETHEPGSYYAASPWRRILVSLAGPLFNLLFASLVLALVWGIGFSGETLSNRIILASEYEAGASPTVYPADTAGLKTGDKIIAIDHEATENYREVQLAISLAPEEELLLTLEREGERLELPITPELDKSSGAGKIGV